MNKKSIFCGVLALTVSASCLFFAVESKAFVSNTYNVAAGSRFDIYSTQAGVDAFDEKPLVYMEISDDEKVYTRSVRVIEPDAYPCTGITCEWTSVKTPSGTYELWIQPQNQGQTETPVLVSDAFSVRTPLISNVQRDASEVRRVIVTGLYFGTQPPLIWVSYALSDDGEDSAKIPCPVSTPLAFPDGEDREGESCMNVLSGESRVEFILPEAVPDGVALAVHVENRTGADTATLGAMERDDLTIWIEASPETGGTTSPDGSILVKPGEALEVTATPAQGFRFARWETSANMDILNSDLLSAVVTPQEDGTLYAVFQAVQMEFEGITSASSAIIADPDSDATVSNASLTWNPAYAADTPESKIKYHIYMDDTDDVALLYREENRVETVTGITETTIPLNPVPGAVYYVLVVAEDEAGHRNKNHRAARVVNEEITFKKRIKDVGAIISAECVLSLSEDESVLTIKNGDYWSSFANDDIILFDAGGRQFLDQIDLVYLEGDDTILWVAPAIFGDAIRTGEWNAESLTPDTQDSSGRKDRSFTGTVDFGQGVTAHGRFVIKGLTLEFKTRFPEGSQNTAQVWLKGTLGFYGRLNMNVKAGANNNPGKRKPFVSGKFTNHIIFDKKKIKHVNNLVVELFLYFRAEKAVRFIQSINIEKKFDVSMEIHADETYKVTDNSDDLVFDTRCGSSEFADMEIYFKLHPKLVSSLVDKNPDYAKMSLGIEEKIQESTSGFAGYKAFNITADASSSYSYSTKNFWWPSEYHTKSFPGVNIPVFSLPVISIGGSSYLEQDTTGTYVMKWQNGINNKVFSAQVVWDCYHENSSASYKITPGPVLETENGYQRNLYFTPYTSGRWTITASASGNGFLGEDLGVVFDSVTVNVYEP